jgi:hypothetical protein
MAAKALRRIQYGLEGTAGSATAATRRWWGNGTLNNEQTMLFAKSDIGQMQRTGHVVVTAKDATIDLDSTPATYENLAYLLSATVTKVETGVADTSGSGKVYTFALGTTAGRSVPSTMTVEAGDGQRVSEVEYTFVEQLDLSWAAGEALMVKAKLRGRQETDAEFTSVTASAEHEVLTPKLYIDVTGTAGTIGTTQKTSTFLGWTLSLPSGWIARHTGDGALTFTMIDDAGHVEKPITGTITLEHDATGEAEYNLALAGTLRKARVIFANGALTTSGTGYATFTFKVDHEIQYTALPPLSDQDGNDTLVLPYEVVYPPANGVTPVLTVVNELATL